MAESIKKTRPEKLTGDIENALAQGSMKGWNFLLDEAKKLSKNEARALAILINVPLLRRYLLDLLAFYPHQKGWITKEAFKWWKSFTPALQTEYANKRIRKALKKISNRFGGGFY